MTDVSPVVGAATEVLLPPPPYRGRNKHEVADLNEMEDDTALVAVLWDHLAIHGPMTRDELVSAGPVRYAAVWREYERFHPGVTVKDHDRQYSTAQRWYHEYLIDRFLRRGWFVATDGLLEVAAHPERMTPLSTVGGAVERNLLVHEDEVARKALLSKSGLARRKPSAAEVKALRESLENIGQTTPIVVWEGDPGRGFPLVVVDGQTRLDLLREMGVPESEILYHRLPPRTAPLKVLKARIDSEIARKVLTPEDRKKYVEALTKTGMTVPEIADLLSITARTVYRIQERVGVSKVTAVTPETAREWTDMQKVGWSIRSIADEYGVNFHKVERELAKLKALDAGEEVPTLKLPTQGGLAWRVLVLIAALPGLTTLEIRRALGKDSDHGRIPELIRDGLLVKAVDGTLTVADDVLTALPGDEIEAARTGHAPAEEAPKPKVAKEPKAKKPKAAKEAKPEVSAAEADLAAASQAWTRGLKEYIAKHPESVDAARAEMRRVADTA